MSTEIFRWCVNRTDYLIACLWWASQGFTVRLSISDAGHVTRVLDMPGDEAVRMAKEILIALEPTTLA